jgi:hypothetical protein
MYAYNPSTEQAVSKDRFCEWELGVQTFKTPGCKRGHFDSTNAKLKSQEADRKTIEALSSPYSQTIWKLNQIDLQAPVVQTLLLITLNQSTSLCLLVLLIVLHTVTPLQILHTINLILLIVVNLDGDKNRSSNGTLFYSLSNITYAFNEQSNQVTFLVESYRWLLLVPQ